MSDEQQTKIYIKVEYGSVIEVRSNCTPKDLNIEVCDLDVENEGILKATNKKWDLETNQLYRVFENTDFSKNEKI
jgi:hypothetical protein|tara:strand:+ start:315 stop:539 length:225 start_codon:yes stop_codon:yes gene_type:complete